MNAATTTNSQTCQICQHPIENMNGDAIYVNWGVSGMSLDRPNHKACARVQYARNRRLADGYVECSKCSAWVLDLTAQRLGGRCRSCASDEANVEPAQGEIPTERAVMACGCLFFTTGTIEDQAVEEAYCNACLKAMSGWAQEDITLQACCEAR